MWTEQVWTGMGEMQCKMGTIRETGRKTVRALGRPLNVRFLALYELYISSSTSYNQYCYLMVEV